MARPKSNKRVVRLSVTLDAGDHAALKERATALDLSAAWLVRCAESEIVARHGEEPKAGLPLRRPGHRAA